MYIKNDFNNWDKLPVEKVHLKRNSVSSTWALAERRVIRLKKRTWKISINYQRIQKNLQVRQSS